MSPQKAVVNTQSEFLGLRVVEGKSINRRPDKIMVNSPFSLNHWEIKLQRNGVEETVFFTTGLGILEVDAFSILECLVMDSFVAEMTYKEFCQEYPDPVGQNFTIYTRCQELAKQVQNLFPDMTLEELNQKIEEKNCV